MSDVAAAFLVIIALATVSTFASDTQAMNSACAISIGSLDTGQLGRHVGILSAEFFIRHHLDAVFWSDRQYLLAATVAKAV